MPRALPRVNDSFDQLVISEGISCVGTKALPPPPCPFLPRGGQEALLSCQKKNFSPPLVPDLVRGKSLAGIAGVNYPEWTNPSRLLRASPSQLPEQASFTHRINAHPSPIPHSFPLPGLVRRLCRTLVTKNTQAPPPSSPLEYPLPAAAD